MASLNWGAGAIPGAAGGAKGFPAPIDGAGKVPRPALAGEAGGYISYRRLDNPVS